MSEHHPHRARKRFGQNFLVNPKVIQRIVDVVDPKPGMKVVEVGPGKGALTVPMADRGAAVWAVEIDRDLVSMLRELTGSRRNLHLVEGDFLEFTPPAELQTGFTLVGNLPYNITSPVIDWCMRHFSRIEQAVFMVQAELADRIAGSPGSKNWGPLSMFTQMLYTVTREFKVAPGNFRPVPNVQSSVIRLTPRTDAMAPSRELELVVRQSFRHRRKTLVNNLVPEVIVSSSEAVRILGLVPIKANVRAEQMSTTDFLSLTDLLVSHKLV